MGTVRYTVLDGEILSENRNGVKRDYVPDPLGSTVALLDNTQTQTDTYSFWPYGETRTSTGTTPTPFNFIGTKGYYADTAGISLKKYVRARYYDTFRSRWLTEDSIGFDGRDYNLYRYVKNNPTSTIDPSGLAGVTKQDCEDAKEKCLRASDREFTLCEDAVNSVCGGGVATIWACSWTCIKAVTLLAPEGWAGGPLIVIVCAAVCALVIGGGCAYAHGSCKKQADDRDANCWKGYHACLAGLGRQRQQ